MAKAAKKPEPSYQELYAELEEILDELQREDLDIDKALARYERGLFIVKALEAYLVSAENRVQELKAQFDATA